MENKPTRAQLMAEQYGAKLDKINGTLPQPRKIKQDDTETPEVLAKRKRAMEKLSTFKDLLG